VSTIGEDRALRNAASVEPLGSGRYSVDLSAHYTAVDHPNGGYLQCVLANGALAAASEMGAHHLHVTAITTNYIGAPALGPAELYAEVRRVGRGVSFVHVTLAQGDEITTESLVTLGTLSEESEARYMDASPPEIAPLDGCHQSLDSEEVNIRRVVDLRLDPSCANWWDGELSERGEVRGWMRLDDGDGAWSAWSLLFASDAMPPATFPLGSSGWVPTLQLTSYVRRVPTSEWLRFRQWCVVIADGIVDERCELFDDRDELVASATQIAMVRFPGVHG
jgi:acyl-coenzyme A thioesterase PaaI-like protein